VSPRINATVLASAGDFERLPIIALGFIEVTLLAHDEGQRRQHRALAAAVPQPIIGLRAPSQHAPPIRPISSVAHKVFQIACGVGDNLRQGLAHLRVGRRAHAAIGPRQCAQHIWVLQIQALLGVGAACLAPVHQRAEIACRCQLHRRLALGPRLAQPFARELTH
jgi:hypothetical protein